jgi:pimeloyl-ACP methyl ester carboxylesterase
MWKWSLALALLCAGTVQAGDVQVVRPGYKLQAEQQGDGAMTVVFESGFGQGADAWKDVIAELGADCRCIAYARAGLGKSGTDGKSKTIEAHLQDLDAVITTLAPNGKVVLVGHSYGGLLATEYARLHSDRVQGLVLVDPATMGQRHAFRKANAERVLADDKTLLSMLPPNLASDYRLLIAQLDDDAAAVPRTQPDVPVALLTDTQVSLEPFVFEETEAGKALWKQQHAELFASYKRGVHRYLATGHNIHAEDPKAVAEAIRSVSK